MGKQITATYLVKNEEEHILESLQSISGLADFIIIIDTGSIDKTIQIIDKFKRSMPDKIWFFLRPTENYESRNLIAEKLTAHREDMLSVCQRTLKAKWMFIVDGDEVYPKESVEKIKLGIKENQKCNIFGWRFKEPDGYSKITTRLIRLNPYVKWHGLFPKELLFDNKGRMSVKNRQRDDVMILKDVWYHHYSRSKKYQWRKKKSA